MSNRRAFLQHLAGIGVALPFLNPTRMTVRPEALPLPLIVCSRGEEYGRKVLDPAWGKLQDTGSILDAIEAGANVPELDPNDQTVGFGGFPNEDGVVSLDASVMYGPTHNCGSVAGLEHIKRACSVARLVMERTDHMMLVGDGALRFARAHGFPEENLLTDRSRREWLRWKENMSTDDDWFPPANGDYGLPERPGGTINVLGIDIQGAVAGITTTSGLFGKISGRVGDSPIIGAGLYVDNAVGAAGATGRGEEVIRTCGSFYVVECMRQGMSPEEACLAACLRIVELHDDPDKIDFNDKFIAINKEGEAGCASVQGGKGYRPNMTVISPDGIRLVKGAYVLEVVEK